MPLGFPVAVPKNGDDFDATPVGLCLTYLLSVLQAYDLANAAPGTMPDAAFSLANSPLQRYADMFQSFIVSGGLSTGFTVLSYSVPAITAAYFSSNGKGVRSINGVTKTAAISSDTYVYVNSNGVIDVIAVANNAAQPSLPSADSQWLEKVISNGTTITSIVDLRNLGPVSQATVGNPYKFRVNRVSAANSGNGNFLTVVFDTKQNDTSLSYNTATGIFTAPIAGFYQFNWSIQFASSSVNTLASLYRNGVEISRGSRSKPSASTSGSSGGDIVQLATGDTVGIAAYADATTALDVVAGPSNNYFSGFLVSRT